MAGTEETYHLTREDLRKAESKVSQKNDGVIPKDSEVSILKVRQMAPFTCLSQTTTDPAERSQSL